MNTEREVIISKIIDGKSVRIRESFFIKNNPDIYKQIVEFCSLISDIKFIQKIWHWVNDVPTYYICKCGKRTSFNRNYKDGYKISCSSKCSQSNKDTKEKTKPKEQ